MWDSEPYQLAQPLSAPARAAKRRNLLRVKVISSSRGRIHSAIEANNISTVRTILHSGMDVINAENVTGWTPLLHAAFLCRESICRLLLKHGAAVRLPIIPIHKRAEYTQNAINHAVDEYEDHVMTLQILLVQATMEGELLCQELLADRKLVVALTHIQLTNKNIAAQDRDRIDLTAVLHFVVTNNGGVKAVELLLAMGAAVDGVDEQGRTPLFHAACKIKEDMCRVLLENGANTQSIRGMRPSIDILTFLQRRRCNLQKPLQTVPQLLKIMKAHVAGQLHSAIKAGNVDWVSTLLEGGADIEEPDNHNRTPLLNAARGLQDDVCKILLEKGANTESIRGTGQTVNIIDFLRRSPDKFLQTIPQLLKIMQARMDGQLHLAIDARKEGWVLTLLDCGADIEEIDSAGRTPLAHAVSQLDERICKGLLERGANTEVLKGKGINFGRCPSTNTSTSPAQKGVQKGVQNVFKSYPSVIALVELMDLRGKLHRAIGQKNTLLVHILLASRASVDEPDSEGRTPIVHAAVELQEAMCELLLEPELTRDHFETV